MPRPALVGVFIDPNGFDPSLGGLILPDPTLRAMGCLKSRWHFKDPDGAVATSLPALTCLAASPTILIEGGGKGLSP